MENLALRFNISVEAGLRSALEAGLGDLRVGWVGGITGSQEGLHFSGSQSRLQQVKDILALESVVVVALLLGSGKADEGEKNQELHDGCGVRATSSAESWKVGEG